MLLKEVTSLAKNDQPLVLEQVPVPEPGKGEVLLRVLVCGVCHTELDEIEGRIADTKFPVIPGHQVVGTVEKRGEGATRFPPGQRVGVAWIFASCGSCSFCLSEQENLCDDFRATGKDVNGGYAQFMVVPENFAYPVPDALGDAEAAPLLCAGAIGYRSLRLCGIGKGDNLGLMGFGGSAHLVLKLVRYLYPEMDVFVFARREEEREFARELGACWAGDISEKSPRKLRAVIDTTPVWKTVVESLDNLDKGGRLVINAIRKEEVDKDYLQNLDYRDDLWMEKEIKSVANVTRKDVSGFLELAAKAGIRPTVRTYPLEAANKALSELREGNIRGAKVLQIG